MPYIDQMSRTRIAGGEPPSSPGELNYALTMLVNSYLRSAAEDAGRVRYAHLNEVVGVLECAKLELYRRVASPYEDQNMRESGDVYSIV